MDSEAFGRFLVILGATTLIGVIWLILFSTSKGWDLFWSMASIIGSFIIISGVIVIFDILHSRYNDPKKPINSQGRIQEKSITKKPKKRGYLNRAVFLTVSSAALGSVFGMFYQSYASLMGYAGNYYAMTLASASLVLIFGFLVGFAAKQEDYLI